MLSTAKVMSSFRELGLELGLGLRGNRTEGLETSFTHS